MSRTKILIIFLAITAVALGGFYVYRQTANGGVSLDVEVPEDEVSAGEPFEVRVIFTNNSGNTLENVRLNLNFPGNLVSGDDGSRSVAVRELGDISDGRSHQEIFRVVATPGEEPDYRAEVSAFYSPRSLVAEFRKTREAEIRVERPDFDFIFETPETVFSGEEFEAKVSYERDQNIPELAELEVHVDYPRDVAGVGSEPEATDSGADGMRFRNLDREEDEKEFVVRGKVELPDGAEFRLGARLVMRIFGEEYTFLSEERNIIVTPSPLSFQIFLADRASVVEPGELIAYVLTFRNNTNVDMRDIVVRAQLIGDMFDIGTVETDGAVNITNNTVAWNPTRNDELRELRAGQEGRVTFTVRVRDRHPVRRINDKNFKLVVDGRIESPTVPFLIEADRTLNTARLETNVAGRLEVDARALFRDAASGIINSGPLPPRVGVPTNFTVHWRLTNYGTDVDNVEVRGKLGPGVRLTGVAKSNTDTKPKLDPATGEVVWQVSRLIATTGVLNDKPEAVFQVEATPQASETGSFKVLLESTRVTAHDEFTGINITYTDDPLTTRLSDDPTVSGDTGKVVE